MTSVSISHFSHHAFTFFLHSFFMIFWTTSYFNASENYCTCFRCEIRLPETQKICGSFTDFSSKFRILNSIRLTYVYRKSVKQYHFPVNRILWNRFFRWWYAHIYPNHSIEHRRFRFYFLLLRDFCSQKYWILSTIFWIYLGPQQNTAKL